ncbi:hypothetical protein [Ornithinibacillus halophilus]|uniref:Uncharacterized protein n=1 Tax=Ornithinibacillus halophilus TaxID=930117 RepID=A0A1M5L834_9BACI|nr:hypothetical protein [Ornithinibacillus halophilus]SHG61095.1 hypothetical protein SAMN05216225_10454 [Ornithinibacillus halophilus]
MADVNKNKREDQNEQEKVGSGFGIAPGDTIASALDPFGGAAAAVGDMDNMEKKDTEEDNYGNRTKE